MGGVPDSAYGAPGCPGYGAPGCPGCSAPGCPGCSAPGWPGYGAPDGPGYGFAGCPGYGSPGCPGYGIPAGPAYGAYPAGAGRKYAVDCLFHSRITAARPTHHSTTLNMVDTTVVRASGMKMPIRANNMDAV
ncbi:hypothetical protein FOH10_21055 [Nocardia otitidiscaviarum]|uniref:Uncharacterized protein n=1 Tax=Nocardia otitidiscaviarum TaxID=1823 RepID=A0A516NPJ1_9NOCA|nr:hypothetical protein FOH10_21055 [Nocardia otitidiscaviarum]